MPVVGNWRMRHAALGFDRQAIHLPEIDLPAVVAPQNVVVAVAIEVAGPLNVPVIGIAGRCSWCPPEIIDKLNKEINAGLADPKMKIRLAGLGGTPLLGSPADFGKLIADETDKWGKVVKFSGAKVE